MLTCDYHLSRVGLDELDWEDLRFEIKSFASAEALEASFAREGVLMPPLLARKEGGGCTVIDGFKRLQWMCRNGNEEANCLMLPSGFDLSRLMLWRIETKLFGPPLNSSEKAQLVVWITTLMPENPAAPAYLRILGVSPRLQVIDRWCRMAHESEAFLMAMASEDVSELAALKLVDWEADAKKRALRILQTLRCSASIQVEILQHITEIAMARNVERFEILSASEVVDLLEHPEWDRRRKTQALRDLLYRWRFPRLHAREESFRQSFAAAALPGAVRIIPPPAFEGEKWQLQITFTSPEDLQLLLSAVQEYTGSSDLQSLMRRPQ